MRSLFALFVAAFLITFACKKSTEPPKGIPEGMRATIDGSSWVADSAAALYVTGIDTSSGQLITAFVFWGIKSRFQEGSVIQMEVPEFKVGTFTTNAGSLAIIYVYGNAEEENLYFAIPGQGSGTLTISKFTGEKAEGKFSFVAVGQTGGNSVKVESGSFNVPVVDYNINQAKTAIIQPGKWTLLSDITEDR
jgi:hypothetical protein